MKQKVTVKATIYSQDHKKEDRVEMEVNDLVDYLTLKYVTRGNKLQALPVRFVTELSRQEQTIKESKERT